MPPVPGPILFFISIAVGVGVFLVIWRLLSATGFGLKEAFGTMLGVLLVVAFADQALNGGRLTDAIVGGAIWIVTAGCDPKIAQGIC